MANVTISVANAKANAPAIAVQTYTHAYFATTEDSRSMAGLMPRDAGELTYIKGTLSKTGSSSVYWEVDSKGLVTFTITGGSLGDKITLSVIIRSDNYQNTTVKLAITLTDGYIASCDSQGETVKITLPGVPQSDDYYVAAARYQNNGKLISATILDAGDFTDGFALVSTNGAGQIKAFILGGDYAPLFPAASWQN